MKYIETLPFPKTQKFLDSDLEAELHLLSDGQIL